MRILSLLILICFSSFAYSQTIFRFDADSAICFTQKQLGYDVYSKTDTLSATQKHQVRFLFIVAEKADSQLFCVTYVISTNEREESSSSTNIALIESIPHPAYPGKYITRLLYNNDNLIDVISDQPLMKGNITLVTVESASGHWHFYSKPKEELKAF